IDTCWPEWPRTGRLNVGAAGWAGCAARPEAEPARAIAVSEPATHSATMAETILCRTADRQTSPIAPAHVCCPMLCFTLTGTPPCVVPPCQPSHGSHKRQPQAGAAGMPAVAAAEPVEDAPEHFRRDALAGVRDDHVDRQAIPGRSDGQLYDIAVTSVPDGVLQQRVDREAETL